MFLQLSPKIFLETVGDDWPKQKIVSISENSLTVHKPSHLTAGHVRGSIGSRPRMHSRHRVCIITRHSFVYFLYHNDDRVTEGQGTSGSFVAGQKKMTCIIQVVQLLLFYVLLMSTDESSSSFLACNSGLLSAVRRHHPPQRPVMTQICCFGERKVVLFQILLDGAEPRDAGTTWLSSLVCRRGG